MFEMVLRIYFRQLTCKEMQIFRDYCNESRYQYAAHAGLPFRSSLSFQISLLFYFFDPRTSDLAISRWPSRTKLQVLSSLSAYTGLDVSSIFRQGSIHSTILPGLLNRSKTFRFINVQHRTCFQITLYAYTRGSISFVQWATTVQSQNVECVEWFPLLVFLCFLRS